MAPSLYVNAVSGWWVEGAEGKPNKCVYLNLLFNKKSVKSQQCLAQYIKMWIRRRRQLESYLYVWMMVECNSGKSKVNTHIHTFAEAKEVEKSDDDDVREEEVEELPVKNKWI